MTLSEELVWRNQVKDKTFDDLALLDDPKTFYLGVDCSSSSMTIGNLAVFMLARRLLDGGWKTILLVGGATSLIGDPGGKDEERALKSREEIQTNVAGVKSQVERLFANKDFTLVDNYDWFKDIGYLEFLRDVGKHYSMSELIQKDFIASRMGEGGGGISYAEFSYNLIQGYDFWHLYKNYGVTLQIGGSDQWGNMLSGVPLIRKKENIEVNALSAPLVINKATGKKFGKSEAGAVWLDESLTSVYSFYQFWLNTDDEGVVDYLKVYTLLSREEIESLVTQSSANPEAREAQKRLAFEVTKIVHGEEKANIARRVTETLFGSGNAADLSNEEIDMLSREIPTTDDKQLVSALVATNIASSNSDARRLLESNAVSVNGLKITEDTLLGDVSLIKKGKNGFALVR